MAKITYIEHNGAKHTVEVETGDVVGVPDDHGELLGELLGLRVREGETGEGRSEDRTLAWRWHVAADGTRTFDAWLWNGKAMVPVVQDRVAAAR